MKENNYDEMIEFIKNEFLERASYHDQTSAFPKANFDLIVQNQLHTVNLSEEYGGKNFGFEETADLIINISSGCPSTALSIAMHYYTLGGLRNIISDEMKEEIFKDIWLNGYFIASFNGVLVNDHKEVEAVNGISIDKVAGGYIVNGVKPVVSGSYGMKYLPIYGYQNDLTDKEHRITALMLDLSDQGVEIQKTWNYSGMRASVGHDIQFTDVFVPKQRLIGREGYAVEDTHGELAYWSKLAVISVYHGISQSAYDYIMKVIKQKKDSFSKKTLALMPGIHLSIANIKTRLITSYNHVKIFAKMADEAVLQGDLTEELLLKSWKTKQYVTQTANEIVYLAMQIEGMNSLNCGSTLERLYRDVRAATFHQPYEYRLKEILAKNALGL